MTRETEIEKGILGYYAKLEGDPHHRYRSWEHCYRSFQRLRSAGKPSGRALDNATLSLAFYLASWGMYRGSSLLLQKDYKVHAQVVSELLRNEYRNLWRIDIDSHPETDLVMSLVARLKLIYEELGVSPTNTLVTKVILGTLGCVPAYDQFFIDGVTHWNRVMLSEYSPKFPAHYCRDSYEGLVQFCRTNHKALRRAQQYINGRGLVYPSMKLVDMYFWNLGYHLNGYQ